MGHAETVRMAGRDYLPQEISAIILKRLKEIAEARLGHAVSKAVITVPAYFSDTQRLRRLARGRRDRRAGGDAYHQRADRRGARLSKPASTRASGSWSTTWAAKYLRCLGGADRGGRGRGHFQPRQQPPGWRRLRPEDRRAPILEHLKLGQAVDVSDQPRAMARILRASNEAGEAAPVRSPVRAHRGRVPDRGRRQAGAPVDGTCTRRVRSDDRAVCARKPCRRSTRRCGLPT